MDAIRALCGRCVVMNAGRMIAEGAPRLRAGRARGRARPISETRRCLRSRASRVAYGQHRALDGVALTVGRGEIVVMLGANGAGKTHAAQGHRRPRARRRPASAITLGGRDLAAPAAARDRRSGHRAGARRARHLRRPDGAREPAARRLCRSARAPARKRDARPRCSDLFPRLEERARPERPHHVAAASSRWWRSAAR